MPKMAVIKVEWIKETEVRIYPPDSNEAWWGRPVPKYNGTGEVWELNKPYTDEPEGYFPDVTSMFQFVSEEHDDAPVIVNRELQ